MKKIVPVIMLYLSAATIVICGFALTYAIISCSIPALTIIAIPASITGLVCAMVFAPLSFLFKKDILCKISFFINLVSLSVAIAAVSVGFSVL